jgi:hypothetical protein
MLDTLRDTKDALLHLGELSDGRWERNHGTGGPEKVYPRAAEVSSLC